MRSASMTPNQGKRAEELERLRASRAEGLKRLRVSPVRLPSDNRKLKRRTAKRATLESGGPLKRRSAGRERAGSADGNNGGPPGGGRLKRMAADK